MHNTPPVIGLVGGIGSGKSFVAGLMKAKGAVVLDADRVGHEVLREPAVKQAARERWGGEIFAADGEIIRRALGRIVFAPTTQGAEDLAYLEQLTHPRIGMRLRQQIADLATGSPPPAIVLDAPVLLKAGWNAFCTKIVFVDAPEPVRLARVLARGWTEEEFRRREAAQEPLEFKRQIADEVLDSGVSPAETAAQLDLVWPRLIGSNRL